MNLLQFVPDGFAAVEFAAGQCRHIQAVALGALHVDPAHPGDGGRAAKIEAFRRAAFRHIAQAVHQANPVHVRDALRARGIKYVPVARGIDNHLRADRHAPCLALEQDPLDGVAVLDHVRDPTVQDDIDPFLAKHFGQHIFSDFGVRCGIAGATFAVVDRAVLLFIDARQNLVANAPHHLHAFARIRNMRAQDNQHQAGRPQASKTSVPLDQRGVDSRALCRKRRNHARGPSAHNEDIGITEYRDLPSGLDDLAVLEERRCPPRARGNLVHHLAALVNRLRQNAAHPPRGQGCQTKRLDKIATVQLLHNATPSIKHNCTPRCHTGS